MSNKMYNYSNFGIDRMVEQMQQMMKPVVDMINSTTYQSTIQLATKACIESNKIMQQYLQSNVVENIIRPTLTLYQNQMSKIIEIIPNIMTDNLYNTLSAYKNIINEINLNNLIINDNGTIEYEGDIFTEDEIEESSTELIKDIEENKSIKIDTILKRILLSFIIIFATFFMSGNDDEWILLAIIAGFFGQIGSNMFDFFKNKFFQNYESEDNNKSKYFKENSAIVKLEELKVRKQPNSNEKIIGCLYFSQLVKILDIKPYWIKIEYKDNENKISISGWVSKKGLKRFNILTSQFEDIEEKELGV